MTPATETSLGLTGVATACAIVGVGAAVQGTVGFGLALVAAPLLVLVDPILVPGPLLFSALLLTLLMSHREWSSIDRFGFEWALLGRVVGTGGAAITLVVLPQREMTILFGLLVLLAVGMSAAGLRLRPTLWTLLAAGSLSGFMGTTSSIGGPPLALVYQETESARLRATLAVHFLIGTTLSLVALALVGRFGLLELRAGALLLPGIVLGFLVSARIAPLLDRRRTRTAVLTVSAAAGTLVILRALA